MGENGAGKSTLIKLLAGVVTADALEVFLRGQPVTLASAADAARHGLRFIHQELNVVPELSVAENLFLGESYPRRAGFLVDWPTLNRRGKAALEALGVTHIEPHVKLARLGTGDRMLVNIASALLERTDSEASVYVMDEPTAALTGAETAQLFQVVARLKAKGCAVLYVSHRLDEVFELCERVTVMRDGRTVATRRLEETSRAELIRLMTGRELKAEAVPRLPPSEETVLEVTGLTTERIKNVRFRLHAGEILGVAGLAGSGRSALLRALMGADKVTGGEIVLTSEGPVRGGPSRAWRVGLAYVPEERRLQGLVMSGSVRDNVTLPHLHAFSRNGVWLEPGREARAAHALAEDVRLKATGPSQAVYQLSGGNQQKVVFARALARSPRVLLLDEPTRGVDIGAKHDIYALVRGVRAQGAGIVLASSDLSEVLSLCDRILVLKEGHPVALVEAAPLSQDDLLALCYGEELSA